MVSKGKIVDKSAFQNDLINWFDHAARDLPWRKTYDPYHVWISEVLLQQTQMERGVAYFNRWLERFPDVQAVANGSEDEVLKLWEGLGYYARARNLHAAARIIVEHHNGIVPCDHKELLQLPGVGPYTAAAVASIAGNRDVALVDANVERIYARIFDIDANVKKGEGKKRISAIANEYLPEGRARKYNQAIMELGGLICNPRLAKCAECPVSNYCRARENNTVHLRPVLPVKKKTVIIEMVTGILVNNGQLFIQQRKREDIWGGLWEFPGGTLEDGEDAGTALIREYHEETAFEVEPVEDIVTVTHHYMHYKVVLHCYFCRFKEGYSANASTPVLTAAQRSKWVGVNELEEYGFPAGHRKLLEFLRESQPDRLTTMCEMSMTKN